MIHIVGAGSGAADLITLRGARLLRAADVVVWAGSLVNPELLAECKESCVVYDSAHMTLEEVLDVMCAADARGEEVAVSYTHLDVYKRQREYVLGCAGAEDPAVLHANHLVGAFLCELEFVDGHDDSHIPRFRKVAKYSQQVDLVADIEIRRGLVEHEHTRILRDGACEHDALALPVAYLQEVALGELFHCLLYTSSPARA